MAIERIDRAERQISASAAEIYRAFLDPVLLEKWLPPAGMTGKVHEINPIKGGDYVMSLYHEEASPVIAGKTNEYEDRFRVIFDDLKPGKQVVQRVVFNTSDPSFAGAMKQTWTLSEAGHVTTVSVACENVPAGIRPKEHAVGLNSSLENLALAVETGG
ncbi:SRPBCC domain-containing protein [Paracoccus onubensis]|uniref:ATPase n=1 Tax=Paracoccus onubensis TaxID=1675788 RepID=A0A418SVM3_9RHOB|nr:SRPBCC domain-containing protein [Paracoccus onubensis]RJE85006.1 ATPase [Paracoccus onubensis]